MKQSVTITGENLNVVVNNQAENTLPKSKAEARIAALKAKGIDTSCYFPLGADQVVKIENGSAIPVDMTDEIEKKMVEGGYINHYSLFRRWVMAQGFGMLRYMEISGCNFTELLQNRGYEYSWKVLINELHAQRAMFKHDDKENFIARNRWFDAKVASDMAYDYIETLKAYIEENLMYRTNRSENKTFKHTCKGVPYVRLRGENIFVSDLNRKIYSPLRELALKIGKSQDPLELYARVEIFNKERMKLKHTIKISESFVNAYKGSGAYFTMKNLILFHGARFVNHPTESGSLAYLEIKANAYENEGWRLFGMMKQFIKASGISIQGKINEWRTK